MKIPFSIFLLSFTIAAWAGDFDDGIAAYDKKDYSTALSKFKSAAMQGHASSQANLGVMYFKGEGVAQDFLRALMWFNLAAENGEKNAINNRDIASFRMSAAQLKKAESMAKKCRSSNYTRC